MRSNFENQADLLHLTTNKQLDDRRYYESVVNELRVTTPPSSAAHLYKCEAKPKYQSRYDGETSDHYYRQLVNDTLDQIRLGNTAYIFDLWQMRDVIRFEPLASFEYLPDSDSFAVSL